MIQKWKFLPNEHSLKYCCENKFFVHSYCQLLWGLTISLLGTIMYIPGTYISGDFPLLPAAVGCNYAAKLCVTLFLDKNGIWTV